MKLWTENLGGGFQTAASTINKDTFWIAWENIVAMDRAGDYTIVVFVVSDAEHQRLAEKYGPKPYPKPTES